jgi:F-type H+-transporting ATPase subunit epsilon
MANSAPQTAHTAATGANTILLRIVTPSRQVLSEQVDEIQIPGKAGYLGILPGHAPLLSELTVGELTYRQGRAVHRLLITGGFLEVLPDMVTVLAEAAEKPEEIDIARAQAARDRAEKRLKSADAEVDVSRASIALQRAIIRIQLASKG